MTGIGGQEAAGRTVTVRSPLPDDIDGILDAVRKIILLGEIQSITLKSDEPITYQRFVRAGEELRPEEGAQSFAELTPYEVVRNVRMEEWNSEAMARVRSPHEMVTRMYLEMAVRGWVVTHLLVGEGTRFWKWIEAPVHTEQLINQFLGARIELSKELPADVFILCGAKTGHATIAEIGFAMKGVLWEKS